MGKVFVVCAVYALRHTELERSGVVHLEFSVLHVFVKTVAEDAEPSWGACC